METILGASCSACENEAYFYIFFMTRKDGTHALLDYSSNAASWQSNPGGPEYWLIAHDIRSHVSISSGIRFPGREIADW